MIPIRFSHSFPIWPSSSSLGSSCTTEKESAGGEIGTGSSVLASGGEGKGDTRGSRACRSASGLALGVSELRPSLCSTRYKRAERAAICARKATSSSCRSAIPSNYRTPGPGRTGFSGAKHECNQARQFPRGWLLARLGAGEVFSVIRIATSLVPCYLGIRAQRPRHLYLAARIIGNVFAGNDRCWGNAVFHPVFESELNVMFWIMGR